MPVYEFPAGYDTAQCFLVPINASMIPIIAGRLHELEQRRSWASDTDYELGYNAIVQIEAAMTSLCVAKLVQSNERIYRLLDNALNGTVYVTGSVEPLTGLVTVLPSISDVPPVEPLADSVRLNVTGLYALVDNLTNGTVSIYAPDVRNIRDQLQALIDKAEGTGEFDAEMLAKLSEAVVLLA